MIQYIRGDCFHLLVKAFRLPRLPQTHDSSVELAAATYAERLMARLELHHAQLAFLQAKQADVVQACWPVVAMASL
jgi:hypothetical protein